jgi:hypothetical protein
MQREADLLVPQRCCGEFDARATLFRRAEDFRPSQRR